MLETVTENLRIAIAEAKHLPTQHDQKKHGRTKFDVKLVKAMWNSMRSKLRKSFPEPASGDCWYYAIAAKRLLNSLGVDDAEIVAVYNVGHVFTYSPKANLGLDSEDEKVFTTKPEVHSGSNVNRIWKSESDFRVYLTGVIKGGRDKLKMLDTILGSIEKHLPTRHNQKLHGRTRTSTGRVNAVVGRTEIKGNKGITTIELTGIGSTVFPTDVSIYIEKFNVNAPEFGVVDKNLSNLTAAVDDYAKDLGSHSPAAVYVDDHIIEQRKRYKEIVFEAKKAYAVLDNLRDKIANLTSDDPNDLAVQISMLYETYINDHPEVAKTLHNALLFRAAKFSNSAEFDVFYKDTNEFGAKLIEEIRGVGSIDIDGWYNKDKLNERFGEFNYDNLELNRLAMWERLGTIKNALTEYVSGKIDREPIHEIIRQATENPAYSAALEDFRQFNQWALRNEYGDNIPVYRGIGADEIDELTQAVVDGNFTSLRSFSVSKSVANNFGETYMIRGRISAASILSSYMTDEKMFRAGELELLSGELISIDRFKLVNQDIEDIREFVSSKNVVGTK